MRAGSTILTTLLRAGAPLGPLALLSVAGRKSGKLYTTPVALVEQPDARWLVAAFGEVNWVHNLRAAGSARLTRGRRSETVTAIELRAAEAAPVLKQFLTTFRLVPFIPPYFAVAAGAPLTDFEREAAAHPVFRIVPGTAPLGDAV